MLLLIFILPIPVIAEDDSWLDEEVIFINKEIEDAARDSLSAKDIKTEGRQLTRRDAGEVTCIELKGPLQNKNLSELSKFKVLTKITIYNESGIENWSFLENITSSLKHIEIIDCGITDTHPIFNYLNNWPELTGILNLSQNQITSLNFLESINYQCISLLLLSCNPIEDITKLEDLYMPNLKIIDLEATPISDISPLITWANKLTEILESSDSLADQSRPPNEQLYIYLNHCIYLDYDDDPDSNSPTKCDLKKLRKLCKLYTCKDPLIVLKQPGITTPVTGVTLNNENISLSPGQQQKLEYTITPEDATVKTVRWKSSNEDAVTITRDGIITAKNPGDAEISVQTLNKGYKAICKVTVKNDEIQPVANNIDIQGLIRVGETLTGTYDYTCTTPEGNSTYKWYRTKDTNSTIGDEIPGATQETYTLTQDDLDYCIIFEVTPVAENNISGTPVAKNTRDSIRLQITTQEVVTLVEESFNSTFQQYFTASSSGDTVTCNIRTGQEETQLQQAFDMEYFIEMVKERADKYQCHVDGIKVGNQEFKVNSEEDIAEIKQAFIELVNDSQCETIALKQLADKTIELNISNHDVIVTFKTELPKIDECFIATACFGSINEPAVKLLRQFRDKFLLTNTLGQAFVSFYYSNSPPLADYIGQSEGKKLIARILLMPLIAAAYMCLNPIWLIPIVLLAALFLKRKMVTT